MVGCGSLLSEDASENLTCFADLPFAAARQRDSRHSNRHNRNDASSIKRVTPTFNDVILPNDKTGLELAYERASSPCGSPAKITTKASSKPLWRQRFLVLGSFCQVLLVSIISI